MSHTCCHCGHQFWTADASGPAESCECGRNETIHAYRQRKWMDREPDEDDLEQRRAERLVDERARPESRA